jgi:hypothetical protein
MVIKAMKYQSALKEKPGSLPFEKTISCNIGNPQVQKTEPNAFARCGVF